MAKMSTKKAIIGAVIVMVVWFAIWGIALRYISKQTAMASVSNFEQSSSAYISTNEAFLEEYGKPTDMKAISENIMENENVAGEFYMDFTCTTEKGEYRFRIFGCKDPETKRLAILRYEELPAAQ